MVDEALESHKSSVQHRSWCVEWFGSQGDFIAGKATDPISLQRFTGLESLYAVGPLENARGEVSIYDSAALISEVRDGLVRVSIDLSRRAAFLVYRDALEAGVAAVKPGVTAADIARAENEIFRRHGLGDYVTDAYTRVRGHGLGLFVDTKPHILETVTTSIEAGMTMIVHPNTYHPDVGYMVLGDAVIVTATGADVLTQTPRELFSVPAK